MANFWTSSQAAHLLTKDQLQDTHTKDRAKGLIHEQIEQIAAYHVTCELHASRQAGRSIAQLSALNT